MFCSLNALQVWGSEYMSGGAGCDLSRNCLSDYIDTIDKQCQRDKCGIKTGGYPSCINAAKIFWGYSCDSRHKIKMSNIVKYPKLSKQAEQLGECNLSHGWYFKNQGQAFETFQSARRCTHNHTAKAEWYSSIQGWNVGRYSQMKDPAQGMMCRGSFLGSRPCGYDPAFLSSSTYTSP